MISGTMIDDFIAQCDDDQIIDLLIIDSSDSITAARFSPVFQALA
jgi:hypothetical protein